MAGTYSYTDLEKISNNPTRVINEITTLVEQALGSTDVAFKSPTHPFIVAMDMITGQAWGLINRHEDAVSRVYPFHARNMSDLGRNMSDYQWYGMFSNPSTTQMVYVLPTSEIERLAVDYSETDGTIVNSYRKLVIPKDTRIQVVGTYFSIETPIEIRLMEHGGHSVVYDSSEVSPFNPISTNILEKDYVYVNGVRFIRITIPVRQVNCTPLFNLASTQSGGLKDTYTYTDSLYGIRAFIVNSAGVKTELEIVYNTQVYDRTKPSMTIDLDTENNQFTYEIPEAYINLGTGVGTVSLFVYTSKGSYEQDLKTIETKDHVPEYLDYDYDNSSLDKYSLPIRSVSNQYWKTIQAVSGGTNPRTFDSVRNAVIYGDRRNSLPITPNQYSFNIEDSGFSEVKSIDYVGGRLYKVSSDLPLQTNKNFDSGIGTWVGDILYSLTDLVKSGVVYDNTDRVTIPSKTLFLLSDTGNSIVSSTTLAGINALADDELIDYIKANRMVFTPMHYVVDTTESQLNIRVYYLDVPTINYQRFLYENTTLNIEVGVGSATIEYTSTGYVLTIGTTSGDDYKALDDADVGLQLSFQPNGSSTYASMKGTLKGTSEAGERIWEFKIPTNFDIDSSDNLHLSGFSQYGQVQDVSLTALTNNFSLLFVKTGAAGFGISDSDKIIDRTLFSTDYITIVETTFNIQLGVNMDGMYVRARPVVGSANYKTYDQDIPATYGKPVYKRENDQLVFGDDNLPILLHAATDVIYDANNNPVIAYPKGSIVYDNSGNPISLSPRELQYYFTIIGFDAMYYFSTDADDTDYVNSIKSYLQDTVMAQITAFKDRSLDDTKLMFQPRIKLGKSSVVINEGILATMTLDFSFAVTYYMTKTGYGSDDLQSAIRTSTPSVINAALANEIASVSSIQSALVAMAGSEVVDVKVSFFNGDDEIDVASRQDSSASFSIKKVLELTTEGILSIKEDVNVEFKQHTAKTQIGN